MFAARKSEPAKKPICAILHFFHPVLKEWARACQSASGDAGVCSGGAGGAQQPVASLQMTTAARRCAGPMAARVMLAAPPVLPDGGRPVGTARKNFESITLSSPCRPQRRQCRALRRAGSRTGNPRSFPVFPSRPERAGQHLSECFLGRCVLQRQSGDVQQPVASLQMTTAARRCAGLMAARVLFAAPPVLPDGGRPVGTARKDLELRAYIFCRRLRSGDAASLYLPRS